MQERITVPPPWGDLDRKTELLRQAAVGADCDTLILTKQSSISWLLGARSHVPNTLDSTCFDVVVEATGALRVVVNRIEAPRLRATELAGLPADFHVVEWWDDRKDRLPIGDRVATDAPSPGRRDLGEVVAQLRRQLLPAQVDALQQVCRDAASASTRAAMMLRPSMTEYGAAAVLAQELLADGMDPVVLLVAAGARAARDRHPLPTTGVIGERVMLVCCARRHGLVASVTRHVSFVPVRAADRDRYTRLLSVEAAFLEATRPGQRLGDAFSAGIASYAEFGFNPSEWHAHHQGGLSGWEPREFPANPHSPHVVGRDNVVAWNPSADGWKVEDTCLVGTHGPQPLVEDEDWPTVMVGDRRRPDILELG